MKTNHTPGPWKWDKDRDQILAANHSIIAKLATGEDRAEENANARLIAAAPKLLESLRMCVAFMDDPPNMARASLSRSNDSDAFRNAVAAISAAA